MSFLVNLLGAAALLLWGLRMVRTGVLRAFGNQLHEFLGRTMANRFTALIGGLGSTLLLQSSSATALIASSFAARKVVEVSSALAIMLGADLGTSLVAQAYALRIEWISPALILCGWVMFHHFSESRTGDFGRAIVGLGLALLGLHLISAAAEPLRTAPAIPTILGLVAEAPIAGVILGAVLTIACTSSLAVVLLIVSFAANNLIPLDLAFALVLGANLGSAAMPIMATLADIPEARRVPFGNLLFRLVGVGIALPLLPLAVPEFASFGTNAGRQILNFHVAFNLGLAAVLIWFVTPIAWITKWVLPSSKQPGDVGGVRYISEEAKDTPSIGLANARREALRIGDLLDEMLDTSLLVFRSDDRKLISRVSDIDREIDRLNEAIKFYLTRISRDALDPNDRARIVELITFATNLEHAADIVDRSLMKLAAKKMKRCLQFSSQGSAEIEEIHRRLNANVKLAMNVLMTADLALARKLFEEKRVFRELERAGSENHLLRLRDGRIESISTSSLHLDILRDLKRINSHLVLVAQPLLEAAGELHPSRLREDELLLPSSQ